VTKKAAQWGHQAADSAGRRRADSASVFQCSMNESNMSNGCGFSLGLMPVAAVAGEGDGRVGDVFQQIARRDVEFAAEGSEHVVVGAVDLAVAPTPERGVVHPCGLGQGSYCDPLSPIAALSQYFDKVASESCFNLPHLLPIILHHAPKCQEPIARTLSHKQYSPLTNLVSCAIMLHRWQEICTHT